MYDEYLSRNKMSFFTFCFYYSNISSQFKVYNKLLGNYVLYYNYH